MIRKILWNILSMCICLCMKYLHCAHTCAYNACLLIKVIKSISSLSSTNYMKDRSNCVFLPLPRECQTNKKKKLQNTELQEFQYHALMRLKLVTSRWPALKSYAEIHKHTTSFFSIPLNLRMCSLQNALSNGVEGGGGNWMFNADQQLELHHCWATGPKNKCHMQKSMGWMGTGFSWMQAWE